MLTERQIRDVAAAEWGRYFNRKVFPKRDHLLITAIVLLLVSFSLMLVVSSFINNINDRQLTTRVIPSNTGIISVTVGQFGFISAYQKAEELPTLGVNTVTSPVRTIPDGLNGLSLVLLLASCVLFLMWYFVFLSTRDRYLDRSSQLWVDSGFKQIPDRQSVIDFIAKED